MNFASCSVISEADFDSQPTSQAAGRPSKLHAKCAIIDDAAVIGSANLTDDAFNRNMELGVIVRERSTVLDVVEHFEELVRCGILVNSTQAKG